MTYSMCLFTFAIFLLFVRFCFLQNCVLCIELSYFLQFFFYCYRWKIWPPAATNKKKKYSDLSLSSCASYHADFAVSAALLVSIRFSSFVAANRGFFLYRFKDKLYKFGWSTWIFTMTYNYDDFMPHHCYFPSSRMNYGNQCIYVYLWAAWYLPLS